MCDQNVEVGYKNLVILDAKCNFSKTSKLIFETFSKIN